jgi:hypothetical protein
VVAGALGIWLALSNWHSAPSQFDATAQIQVGAALLLGGLVLVAAGLHALQGAYTACCDDWCDDDGCGCGHCDGCKGGECCGHCGCPKEVSHEHGPGGHQH